MTEAVSAAMAIPKAPPQLTDRLTGYVTWRSPYPGWDAQQLDAITFLSVAGIFFGLVLAVNYRQKTAANSTLSANFSNMSVLMTTLVTYYLYATLATVIGFWVIDVGKVWVVLGVLHNSLEFCILFAMASIRNRKAFDWFYVALFAYWLATQILCIFMPWPMDGVYFKFQGLILDFALVINFYRLMMVNDYAPIHLTEDDDEEEDSGRPVLITHVAKKHHAAASGSTSLATAHLDPTAPLTQNTNIHLLLIAAIIHLIGNLVTVVSLSKYPFLLFQLCYGITFPIYGYYVAKQPGASRMRWFEATKCSETWVFVASTIGAAVFSAIGIYVTESYYGWS